MTFTHKLRRFQASLDNNHALLAIFQAIHGAGGTALLIGGCVRDALMGLPAKDFDIEVYGLGLEALLSVLTAHGKVDQVGRAFGVIKVKLPAGEDLDVSLPRLESVIPGQEGKHKGFLVTTNQELSVKEAAARRDFTVNTLSYNPLSGELFDYYQGRQDLTRGVIRHTSTQFGEDPLRVLRAMQFAGRWGFEVAPETVVISRQLKTYYHSLPLERVWGEWEKLLTKSQIPGNGLQFLLECGWLEFYPALARLVGCPQDGEWHPEGDVWAHSLYAANKAVEICNRNSLHGEARLIIVLGALLHDVGKPDTTTHDPDGHIRSKGHAEAGVPIAEQFLQSIGTPVHLIPYILPLVGEHMCHIGLEATARNVRRLAQRLYPASVTQWEMVIEADASGRPPFPDVRPAERFLHIAVDQGCQAKPVNPLIMGRDLLSKGLKPGPQFKVILNAALEAQLEGHLDAANRQEWLTEYLTRHVA